METRVVLALVVAFVLGAEAAGRAETVPPATNKPDGGASLVDVPGSSAGTPTSSESEGPWPPPRSLDSKRAPVPDRLMLPEDMLDIPLAPPTPPVPNNSGSSQTGGGANHANKIFQAATKGTSGAAPSDISRDNVTRTPEDQLAPPAYPAQGPR